MATAMGDLGATATVLIVEDDDTIATVMAFHLRGAGLAVRLAADGARGLRAFRRERPDVLVLDLMLPEISGWQILEQVRREDALVPILVTTARVNEEDRVHVLAMGADDVMAKPLSLREFVARVQGMVRRARLPVGAGGYGLVLQDDLEIDPETLTVTLAGSPAELTPLEFQLLWALVRHHDQVLSRDQIFRLVWQRERGHGDRSVDTLVKRLRSRLERVEPGRSHLIETIAGVGYRYMPMKVLRDPVAPAD
jgi:DNA-binding response OmpR family regulator